MTLVSTNSSEMELLQHENFALFQMWELLLVVLVAVTTGTIDANMTTAANVGIATPPLLGGLAGPFGKPVIGASGLGTSPRFGADKNGKSIETVLWIPVFCLDPDAAF